MATDPVCGMAVTEEKPPATSHVEDTVYYFCSMGCKVAFEGDPEKYLPAPGQEKTQQKVSFISRIFGKK